MWPNPQFPADLVTFTETSSNWPISLLGINAYMTLESC